MSYAIFKAGGRQYRAEIGRSVRVPLMDVEPGDQVSFDDVLLSSDGETVRAGQPCVEGAKVTGQILGHGQDEKIYVFRFKRRKNYRKKTGHRQKFTEVMITDLQLGS